MFICHTEGRFRVYEKGDCGGYLDGSRWRNLRHEVLLNSHSSTNSIRITRII